MFLVDQELNIPNFLQVLGFIAPEDYSLDYILAPDSITDNTTQELIQSGFQPPAEDSNIKYFKKDPEKSHSFSDDTIDITNNNLAPMPINDSNEKSEKFKQMAFFGNQVRSPYQAIKVAESTENNFTIELNQPLAGLPKRTMINFSKLAKTSQSKPKIKETRNRQYIPISIKDFNNIAKQTTKICNQILGQIEDFKQATSLFVEANNRYNQSYNIKNSLILKYRNDKIGNGIGLPGIIASAVGNYDINSVKTDSENMKQTLAEFKQAEYQKDLYLNNMKRAYSAIQSSMRGLMAADSNMDVWMQQSIQDTDWID